MLTTLGSEGQEQEPSVLERSSEGEVVGLGLVGDGALVGSGDLGGGLARGLGAGLARGFVTGFDRGLVTGFFIV